MGKTRIIGRIILLAKPSVQGSPKRFRRIAADILPIEGFEGTEDSDEALWDQTLDVNLKGTYLTTQAAVRQMQKEGGGAIVNIGTVMIDHAMAGMPASAALVSKGGIHALTISLAAELAADNIRVNAVAPGVIRTPIYGDADVDSFGAVALLKRVGEVNETTDAVMYLATANFTTGHILRVDGGYVTGRS
jgi:NAD(P)-dependent dehydrogenase (short-subunit alcohol dehydrogenase family)